MAISAMVLACAAVAACAPVAAPFAGAASQPPACRTATVPVTVGGRPEQAAVEACPQPDGSWRITQTTPGLPPQVYLMPPPPPELYPSALPDDADYFDYWPYWAGPWFWGIGPTVVIVRHFHHFHHFDHLHPGFGRPPPHAFAQGSGHAGAVGAHR